MSQKYTRVPTDAFEKLQLNAGILVDAFNPSTGVIGNILGATTGGIQFSTNPEYVDFGEDVDNVPNNMMEFKHLKGYDPQMAGTFLTCSQSLAKRLVGAADMASDGIKVVPRAELLAADFMELWWIGDYSDVNTGDDAGFLAIHLMNALNTAGFQIQSTKDEKGQLAFEFHGHYTIEDQDTAPFEIYVKAGDDGSGEISVTINEHYVTVDKDDTVQLSATTKPAGLTVTWTSASTTVATVSAGTVEGKTEGNTIITASVTSDGVTATDTCTVVVVDE
jgi:hypothetical protein